MTSSVIEQVQQVADMRTFPGSWLFKRPALAANLTEQMPFRAMIFDVELVS